MIHAYLSVAIALFFAGFVQVREGQHLEARRMRIPTLALAITKFALLAIATLVTVEFIWIVEPKLAAVPLVLFVVFVVRDGGNPPPLECYVKTILVSGSIFVLIISFSFATVMRILARNGL